LLFRNFDMEVGIKVILNGMRIMDGSLKDGVEI